MIEIKGLVDEDFVNYKKPSMFIIFPKCSFKCGADCCQNSGIAKSPSKMVYPMRIVHRYISNPISKAIVIGGLEPFDSSEELYDLIVNIRFVCDDDIVIYTGYNLDEIKDQVDILKERYKNIIIKFGRYVPNQKPHYDEVLGVNLASDNQYALKIS